MIPKTLDSRKPGATGTALAFWKGTMTQDLAVSLVIILVGLASFGLGRLSVGQGTGEAVIRQDQLPAAVAEGSAAVAGGVVASRSGSKYHFPWCAGAQSIKEENKLWFESAEAARAAGYTPASNCKGLE